MQIQMNYEICYGNTHVDAYFLIRIQTGQTTKCQKPDRRHWCVHNHSQVVYALLTTGGGLFACLFLYVDVCVHTCVSARTEILQPDIAAPPVCSKALYCSVSSRLRTTDSRASPQRLTWLHKPWELFQIIQWVRKDELHWMIAGWGFKTTEPVAVNSII